MPPIKGPFAKLYADYRRRKDGMVYIPDPMGRLDQGAWVQKEQPKRPLSLLDHPIVSFSATSTADAPIRKRRSLLSDTPLSSREQEGPSDKEGPSAPERQTSEGEGKQPDKPGQKDKPDEKPEKPEKPEKDENQRKICQQLKVDIENGIKNENDALNFLLEADARVRSIRQKIDVQAKAQYEALRQAAIEGIAGTVMGGLKGGVEGAVGGIYDAAKVSPELRHLRHELELAVNNWKAAENHHLSMKKRIAKLREEQRKYGCSKQ